MSEHTKGKVTVDVLRLEDEQDRTIAICQLFAGLRMKECKANAARLALLWNHFADLTDAEIAAIEVRRTRWFTWAIGKISDRQPILCWSIGITGETHYLREGGFKPGGRARSPEEIQHELDTGWWREIDEPTARGMIDAAKAKGQG